MGQNIFYFAHTSVVQDFDVIFFSVFSFLVLSKEIIIVRQLMFLGIIYIVFSITKPPLGKQNFQANRIK